MVRWAKKNQFSFFFLFFAIEMTLLSVFWQKKFFDSLGNKRKSKPIPEYLQN